MSYIEEQQKVIENLRRLSQSSDSPVSSVPMTESFEDDSNVCLTLLAFVPESIHPKLNDVVSKLREAQDCHYFYPCQSYHITIQNVRRIASPPSFSEENVEVARDVFRELLKNKRKFVFHLKGLLLLRTSISIICYAEDSYKSFIERTRQELENNNIPDDKTYVSDKTFFGNITLVRFTHPPDEKLKSAVESMKELDFGNVELEALSLVTTNSVCDMKKTKIIETYKLSMN